MPYHLVVYRDIPGIGDSLISSFRATLHATKDSYLSMKASTTIAPLVNPILYDDMSSCMNQSACQSGSYLNGGVFPVYGSIMR